MEFGFSEDSRIEASGISDVRLWNVNKIEDTAGNYITLSYLEDNAEGEYYIDRIDYTGNDVAGVAPYASVRFTYNDDREDELESYTNDIVSKVTKNSCINYYLCG